MRLTVLDSLRGLCAVLVALTHLNAVSHITESGFVRGSWLFVDFFFVLSGFVIALVYRDRLSDRAELVAFVIRRFGRLWPLHVSVLLLFVGLEAFKWLIRSAGLPTHAAPFIGSYEPAALGPNLLLVQALGFFPYHGWNTPSWSISVEFYTYLVFAALCLAGRRLIVPAALTMSSLGLIALLLWSPQYLGVSYDFGLFRCLYGFFLGVATCAAYRAWARGGATLGGAGFWETGCLLLCIGFVLVCRIDERLTYFAPPLFAATVFIFAFQGGPWSRLLLRRPFVWLGERSYTIYMVHALVVLLLNRALLVLGEVTPLQLLPRMMLNGQVTETIFLGSRFATDLFVPVYLALVLAAAQLLYKIVEQPGRTFFNNLAKAYASRRAAVPAVAGP